MITVNQNEYEKLQTKVQLLEKMLDKKGGKKQTGGSASKNEAMVMKEADKYRS